MKRGRRSSNGQKRKTISAFNFTKGKKVAYVNHYNILDAKEEKRRKVAKKLKEAGIRKICSDGNYHTVDKFLRIASGISCPRVKTRAYFFA